MTSAYVVDLRTALNDLYDDPFDEEVAHKVVKLIGQRPIVGRAGYAPAEQESEFQ